jgi:hypothetical protein
VSKSGVRVQQLVRDEPVRIEYGIALTEPAGEATFGTPTVGSVERVTLRGGADPAQESREADEATGGPEPAEEPGARRGFGDGAWRYSSVETEGGWREHGGDRRPRRGRRRRTATGPSVG